LGQSPVAWFSEHDNKPSGFIKGEELLAQPKFFKNMTNLNTFEVNKMPEIGRN
jgi:hypothetical protein